MSAAINYGVGVLLITCNETIDSTPQGLVILPNISLSNVSLDEAIVLVGAGVVEKDFTDITITLTEKQRAQAIAMSGTPGGDYGGMFLDVKNASMRDRSGNLVQENLGILVSETADTILPYVISSEIDFTTGTVVIGTSETIDLTPNHYVDLTKFYIVTGTGSTIALTGSALAEVDNVGITLTIPEADRVLALVQSNTPGGNGGVLKLRVDANGYQDIATNQNIQDPPESNVITPHADF